MVDAYPLVWPAGWKRTQWPDRSNFREHSMANAIYNLLEELRRLGATHIVISTNVKLKRDGLPYSGRRPPDDKGVAVYFRLFDESQCIPCDKWDRVEHNIWAIAKTIDALRGLERWGAKEMVKASFQGFKALPEHTIQPAVNYFAGIEEMEDLKARFRKLSQTLHPDCGGTNEEFTEMMRQYEIEFARIRTVSQ